MDRDYFVYEHVTPDGMYYFGVTKNIKNRFKASKYETTSLWDYIQKYGWKNIQHNILMRELTYEEARRTEHMLIVTAREDGVCINKMGSGLVTLDQVKYQHDWYQENKERHNETSKKWREEHREEYNKRSRELYAENPERHRGYARKHYQNNKEAEKERHKRYVESHREELREYSRKRREQNREKINKQQRIAYHRRKQEKQLKELGFLPLF